jgi:hypothetical protein
MDARAFLPKFFVICSVILILAGIAQVFVRPRADRETLAQKIINRSTITAVVSLAFGIVGLLVGLGVFKIPTFGP